ncbi:MAG: long-chain fatty acid--CoA ligase [Firmicutes bacterium]|nr:long-chain fatty acid--CoA ligase [Bacillota bacterium]
MGEKEVLQGLKDMMKAVEADEAAFQNLALQLFQYQYRHNPPYRRFCQSRGRTPRIVKDWWEIPAVPMRAFKEATLSCNDPAEAEAVFMTSGTTRPGKRGKHVHPTLDIYNRSMLRNFRQRFMGARDVLSMGILFPRPETLPHSSLAHYLSLAVREFGGEHSSYLVDGEEVHFSRLLHFLREAERSGEPCALLGASFHFVHVMDFLEQEGLSFRLPEGSRILDTGGLKGQSRHVDPDVFYAGLAARFGVPRHRCINMYGLTELSTQFYDDGNETVPSKKSGPCWIRTRVIDPVSGEDVPYGETGVLVHYDLANVHSVLAVMTEDWGKAVEGGFILMGRAEGAEARGCSLAAEEFLRSSKG